MGGVSRCGSGNDGLLLNRESLAFMWPTGSQLVFRVLFATKRRVPTRVSKNQMFGLPAGLETEAQPTDLQADAHPRFVPPIKFGKD